jgi:6-pyruvoyl-tetrahydropterin synthase
VTRRVFVTTTFAALHRWPDAPEPVVYLRDLHRHLFHVRVELDVQHNDREVEFLMLKDWLDSTLAVMLQRHDEKITPSIGSTSCEAVCEALAASLTDRYPGRGCLVAVSEDGENGALITLRADE